MKHIYYTVITYDHWKQCNTRVNDFPINFSAVHSNFNQNGMDLYIRDTGLCFCVITLGFSVFVYLFLFSFSFFSPHWWKDRVPGTNNYTPRSQLLQASDLEGTLLIIGDWACTALQSIQRFSVLSFWNGAVYSLREHG